MDGLDLHVEDLDAVDGTPVIEAKPWFKEMAPGARPTGPDGPATYSAATTPPPRADRLTVGLGRLLARPRPCLRFRGAMVRHGCRRHRPG
ncbi:hypothetical protein [Streptomyces atratus]|uniref:hypothetical protein n=1 Tax=Streptomyces atratus TaxID=1893 RepID=UPI002109AF95|nr:hypothetical protein [Streptomyces atratus]